MRRLIKAPFAAWGKLAGGDAPGVAFLIYHSVSGRSGLEMDLNFPLFRRQMEHLAVGGGVMAYGEAVEKLASGTSVAVDRQVITFDDGFEDIARKVFPLVRDLGIPITLFATTGLLEGDRKAMRGWPHWEHFPAMSWDDLGMMHESGFVTVGAHTHSHPNLAGIGEHEVEAEIERSQELFRMRLGFEPKHFAYPRAVWSEAAEKVVRAHYATAVLGGGSKALPGDFNPHRIPRVPVRRSDGWRFFESRIAGRLAGEERLYNLLRKTKQFLAQPKGEGDC